MLVSYTSNGHRDPETRKTFVSVVFANKLMEPCQQQNSQFRDTDSETDNVRNKEQEDQEIKPENQDVRNENPNTTDKYTDKENETREQKDCA